MTEQQKKYHEHQRKNMIKTAEQKQAYSAWLLAIETMERTEQHSIETHREAVGAAETARTADRYHAEAIKEERDAWLKFEIAKLH